VPYIGSVTCHGHTKHNGLEPHKERTNPTYYWVFKWV